MSNITSKPFGCVGNTIKLRSGIYFDLANPRPADVNIEDIAASLSKICRFGGHCPRFYSVAEHSVAAANYGLLGFSQKTGLACLLHDAAEAYIGDVVKPLKIMLADYREIEATIENAIGRAFGIDFFEFSNAIREIDQSLLIAERNALFPRDGRIWEGEKDVIPIKYFPQCLVPADAEVSFLKRYFAIKSAVGDKR